MDLILSIRAKDSTETLSLKNGVVMSVTDRAMGYIFDTICTQMPSGYTVFKSYDDHREQWTVEAYDRPRDYKNEPIWRGTFQRKI